jgi:hypothetical protein
MQGIDSAFKYLHSQIDWTTTSEMDVKLGKDFVTFSYEEDGQKFGKFINRVAYPDNPIKAMMDHITEEMCVECLQIDYLFKDPFFVSLTKAYIEFLFATYGAEVSISKEMAQAFILNDLLGEHQIQCRTLETVVVITGFNYKKYDSESCIYKLIQ